MSLLNHIDRLMTINISESLVAFFPAWADQNTEYAENDFIHKMKIIDRKTQTSTSNENEVKHIRKQKTLG